MLRAGSREQGARSLIWRRFVIGAKTKNRIAAKIHSKQGFQIRASGKVLCGFLLTLCGPLR